MERLNILWTSNDRDTFLHMIAMYSPNALRNGWWEKVNIIIWGGSTKLASEDTHVQKEIVGLIAEGVTFEACKVCSDKYKASEILKNLGVEVKYMGVPLTNYIKNSDNLLTI